MVYLISLDYSRICLKSFKLKNKTYTGCIKNNISPSDITRPCSLLMKELKFIKELDTLKKMKPWMSKYFMRDMNELVISTNSPVEIIIKVCHRIIFKKNFLPLFKKGKRGQISFRCGRTKYKTIKEERSSNGWCATKLDKNGEFTFQNFLLR